MENFLKKRNVVGECFKFCSKSGFTMKEIFIFKNAIFRFSTPKTIRKLSTRMCWSKMAAKMC